MRLNKRQSAAAADIIAGLTEIGSRGQMIRACGTGKTLIMHNVAHNFWQQQGDAIVVFCAPTIGLVAQTIDHWQHKYGTNGHDIAVHAICSDDMSDRRIEGGEAGRGARYGIASTTDAAALAVWIAANTGRPRLLVSTHVSLPRIVEALELSNTSAAIAFADEAHKLVGISKPGKPVELLSNSTRLERVLFATATPRVVGAATKATINSHADAKVFCMDDESQFGPVLGSVYTLRQAINAGDLVDYEIIVTIIKDGGLAAASGDDASIEAAVAHIAIANAAKEFGINRIIAYHNQISDSERWVARHPGIVTNAGYPTPTTRHIDGKTDKHARETALRDLGAHNDLGPYILSNCKVLTEGIDVPDLDAVAILAPRKSASDLTQILGRAIRKPHGSQKVRGYLIIPVYRPGLADADGITNATDDDPNWRTVIDVLRQLSIVDEAVREEIEARIRVLTGGGGGEPRKPIIHITGLEPGDYAAISTRMLTDAFSNDVTWAINYQDLVEYLATYGEYPAGPHLGAVGGRDLHSWIGNNNMHYKSGRMPADRIQRLEALPGWQWFTDKNTIWPTAYERYRTNLCNGALDDRDRSWIALQRQQISKGLLAASRLELLEALSDWARPDPVEVWHAHYRSYVKHMEADDLTSDHKKWLSKQRSVHRDKRLSPEQLKLLVVLPGWMLPSERQKWDDYYRQVLDQSRAGAPLSNTQAGWCNRQRDAYRDGELESDQIELLEAITGWTWGLTWDQTLDAIIDRDATGRTTAADARWVARQRKRLTVLNPRQAERLNALAALECRRAATFEDYRLDLVDYLAEHHGQYPPHKSAYRGRRTGRLIGKWVSKCHGDEYPLSAEQRAALEALPGWAWSPNDSKFENAYQDVKQHFADFGTYPPRGTRGKRSKIDIGEWAFAMRSGRRPVDIEQAGRLEALHGWKWTAGAPQWKKPKPVKASKIATPKTYGHSPTLRDSVWENAYADLADILAASGEYPGRAEDHPRNRYPGRLGAWINTQRTMHKAMSLSDYRIKKLEALPGWTWSTR